MESFRVTHAIRRVEYITLVVKANDHAEAMTKARKIVEQASLAEYDPGDEVEAVPGAYEVIAEGDDASKAVYFTDDGEPYAPPEKTDMSDPIVKYQDHVPLLPRSLLGLLSAGLHAYMRNHTRWGVHDVVGAEIVDDGADNPKAVALRVHLAGPAGPEVYDITDDAVADVPADEADTAGPQKNPARLALEEFCDDIDAAGGCTERANGLLAPVGDPGWIDLGETYGGACAALGRAVLLVNDPDEDPEDGDDEDEEEGADGR